MFIRETDVHCSYMYCSFKKRILVFIVQFIDLLYTNESDCLERTLSSTINNQEHVRFYTEAIYACFY